MAKEVTIEDILKAKKLYEKKQNEVFYSETFGGEIKIEPISPQKIVQLVNSTSDDEPLRGDYELIYECCPIFRSKALHDEYEGLEDPVLIVEKAFCGNIFEIDNLAKFILKKYGYYKEIESIKKQ